jgi:hypothetical protein
LLKILETEKKRKDAKAQGRKGIPTIASLASLRLGGFALLRAAKVTG